jgi:hypothetical protein
LKIHVVGGGLDVALGPRAHHEVVVVADGLHEARQQPEVIGQVAVAHDHDLAPDVRDRVDVGAAQAAQRHGQHARAVRPGDLRRAVGGRVHDDDLAGHAGLGQPLEAPVDERADGQLLVQARDDDRDLDRLLGGGVDRGGEDDLAHGVARGARASTSSWVPERKRSLT